MDSWNPEADRRRLECLHIGPAEVLVSQDVQFNGYFATRLPAWHFDVESAKKKLLKQLGAASLAGYGCEDMTLAIGACGALLEYAAKTQGQALAHVLEQQLDDLLQVVLGQRVEDDDLVDAVQ